ncbi:MAG: hypothetical protein JSR80_07710 [Verrucomicrobia bacterium]|nr:hypothetical protein [Verrucomicrobiota bacterium]
MTTQRAGYTVYTIPAGASEAYAATRRIFEEQVNLGMHTVDGSLETRLSYSVRVCNVQRVIPLIELLFGTFIKTCIAHFPRLEGWDEQRLFRGLGSPNMGSDHEIEALKERVRALMGFKGSQQALEQGSKLLYALDMVSEDRRLRSLVYATMAGLAAA